MKKKVLISTPIFLIFLMIYICTRFLGQRPFLYDVNDYWNRGIQLWETGRLSLTIDSYGGYVFPLYLGFCNHYFGGVTGWELFNAIQISIFIVLAIPRLTSIKPIYTLKDSLKSIVFAIILLFLFPGIFVNPSSDIIAIEFSILGQIMICYVRDFVYEVNKKNRFKYYFAIFLVGVFAYCAYNVRTIYVFSVIFLMVEVLVVLYKKGGIRKLYLGTIAIIGLLFAAIPQIIINYRQYGIFSAEVVTNGLFSLQLLWGLKLQRYDTTVSDVLGTARVCFVDRAGFAILHNEGLTDEITYGQYIGLIFKYPFEMIGLYIRHFANILLPVFGENFIRNLAKGKVVSVVISVACIFGGWLSIKFKQLKGRTLVNFLPILIPIIFIILGSVEQRYGVGIYIYLLVCLCYEVDWTEIRKGVTANRIEILLDACVICGLLIAIWTSTLSTIEVNYPPSVDIDYPIFIESLGD